MADEYVNSSSDTQTERKNYNSIDLVKFIMAFAVVAIHTHPLEHCSYNIVRTIYNNIVSMAVPFFFISTGFLLAQKMSFPFAESDIPVIKKQLLRILKMYLLWMAIYTPLAIYHNISEGISFSISCKIYVRGLFLMGEQYNSWPLWYLLSTVYSLLIIMFLIKKKVSLKGMLVVCLLFALLSFGLDWFTSTELPLSGLLLKAQGVIQSMIVNGRIFTGMIYIPLGMYFAHNTMSVPRYVIMLAVGFVLKCFVTNAFIASWLLIVTMVGFWGIIENIKLRDNKIYGSLRSMSTTIYLIHMYIWTFYYFIVYGQKTYGLDSFLVTSIVAFTISMAYLWLVQKRNHVK